ncbi:MAG TPA: hypothetical protein VM580_01100 [Labilithrix sp.]|nr:hypothetical protein [Labilithrix sp.]
MGSVGNVVRSGVQTALVTHEAMCSEPQRTLASDNEQRQPLGGSGTADAACHFMFSTTKKVNRIFRGVIKGLPVMSYITRSRHRNAVSAYMIGGIGLAIAGGIAALMLLSPRTRHRALSAAKDTYGKVSNKVGHLRAPKEQTPTMNNLVDREFPTTPAI